MKAILIAVVVTALLGAVVFYTWGRYDKRDEQTDALPADYKAVTFTISGQPVTLQNGVAEAVTDLGGAAKTMVRYFGNELRHDVDGDGVEDVVFLITQEAGGSGTFFYAVAALKRETGYVGSEALFIGDRIAPQTTEPGEGRQIIINYADRAPGEPMTTSPSHGKSLHLLFDVATLSFGEVVQNFEGEEQ
ncbi:MAG: hypothetical protein AAB388_02875 [Patescibacteria group bacterium]|mgnify:CR=1 FL=1